MAMAGQGLHAAPPPRPAYHNSFGSGPGNPGNQLYVGNVSKVVIHTPHLILTPTSYHTKPAGKTLKTSLGPRVTSFVQIST